MATKTKIDILTEIVTEIKTALVGFNGTTGALDEVKKNTKWRYKITGALILLSALMGGILALLIRLSNKL